MGRWMAYLRLFRPANILTAIADILLGFAASGAAIHFFPSISQGILPAHSQDLGWLVLSTISLYGGGVILNDFYDADLDKIERQERPIPSGQVSEKNANVLGIIALISGVVYAGQVGKTSMLIAAVVAILAILYDAYAKHHAFWGPLFMGSCRGGNLLLGMSVLPLGGWHNLLIILPIIYIGAITMISRGEVHGQNNKELKGGFALYLLVVLIILVITWQTSNNWLFITPFLILFVFMIFPPLIRALRDPLPKNIGLAVKSGVIALIILDATLSVAFADWAYGLLVIALLPLSQLLAKVFAVT